MFRNLILGVLLGTVLGLHRAEATTTGPVCRLECAPRVQQDCGALKGKARKRCRRALVLACKETTPEIACAVDGSSTGNTPGNGGGTPGGGGGNADAVQAITAAFNDQRITIGTSQLFSGGSITETQDMRLCRQGSVLLVVTRVTSTSGLGDFGNTVDSTETFDGTWRVRIVNGAPVLELDVGEAAPRRFAIAQDARGQLFLGGIRADVEDAAGPCGSTPGGGTPGSGGGGSDVAAQVAEALAGRALILTENNPGFGTRRTVIVLCDSRRYVQDVTVSAAPGRVIESIGGWSIELADGAAVLVLTAERGATVRFTVASDAAGGLLLDDLPAAEGDQASVPGICAQL
jgi:hypothetical protein